jgi:hypothetical protein
MSLLAAFALLATAAAQAGSWDAALHLLPPAQIAK